jgi:hypothetical protein
MNESSYWMIIMNKRRRINETNPYNIKIINISSSMGILHRKEKEYIVVKIKINKDKKYSIIKIKIEIKMMEIKSIILKNYKKGNFRRIQYDDNQYIIL